MGLFSSIKKGFKKLFKGIGKIFKKVMGAVGKVLGSKWGKALMMGVAIFTGGMALMGGISGWTQAAAEGASFMGKFVSGAKGFLTALANPVEQAKKTFGAAAKAGEVAAASGQTGAAAQAGQEVANVATATAEGSNIAGIQAGQTVAEGGAKAAAAGAGEAAGGMLTAAQQAGGRQAAAGMFGEVAKKTAADTAKGWLSKAGEFAKDFVMSPTGAQVLGGMATGMAEGAQLEEAMKHQDRIRRRWMDPQNELAQLTQQPGFGTFGPIRRGGTPVMTPGGYQTTGPASMGAAPLPGEPAPIG
jgi:hypothetical protein